MTVERSNFSRQQDRFHHMDTQDGLLIKGYRFSDSQLAEDQKKFHKIMSSERLPMTHGRRRAMDCRNEPVAREMRSCKTSVLFIELKLFMVGILLVVGLSTARDSHVLLSTTTRGVLRGAPQVQQRRPNRHKLVSPHPDVLSLLTSYHEQDPITVNYGGRHPFERRRRRLEEADPFPIYQVPYGDRSEMAPIQIRMITDYLEYQRDGLLEFYPDTSALISFVLESVFPAATEEWSKHLSVVPVVGAIPVTNETRYFNFYPQLQPYLEAGGVTDADIAIFARANLDCGDGTLAYASPLYRDQFDRPILAEVNLCVNNIDLDDTNDISFLVDIAVHEIAHSLGFQEGMMPYFRNPATGEPLTPRMANGGVSPRTVTCVDNSVLNIPFPAENTLKAFTTSPGLSGVMRLHYEMVTPRVTAVARNLFNCQELNGARLENNPTSPSGCAGSHWDERYFGLELMSPVALRRGAVLSPLTLAFLEDSGWYGVSYANVGLASSGLGLGCEFVTGDCIVNDQVPDYGRGIFCDTPLNVTEPEANAVYCDPTHTTFNFCDLYDQDDLNFGLRPKNPILYFSNLDLVTSAGPGDQHDFCPLPIENLNTTLRHIGLDCTDGTNDVQNIRFVGEVYGQGSRCVNTVFPQGLPPIPACLPLECNAQSYQVIIAGRVCNFDFQTHSLASVVEGSPDVMFECPRLSSVCPHLAGCPGACSGRGICNYSAIPAQCECFDPADSGSPLCEASIAAVTSVPSTYPDIPSGQPSIEPSTMPSTNAPTAFPSTTVSTSVRPTSKKPTTPPSTLESTSPSPSSGCNNNSLSTRVLLGVLTFPLLFCVWVC